MWTRVLLAVSLLVVPASAQAAWHRATGKHFTVTGNMQPAALERLATRLERFDKLLRLLMPPGEALFHDPRRFDVYLLPHDQIARLVGSESVGGFYKQNERSTFAVADRERGDTHRLGAQAILFHEYTHHYMLRHHSGIYPRWYVEGFAEFMAPTEMTSDGAAKVGLPPQYRASSLTGRAMASAEVFADNPEKIRLGWSEFYGQAWVATHLLILDPSRRGQLTDYLQRVRTGTGSLAAARAAFGDLRRFDREMQLRLSAVPGRLITADQLTVDPVTIAPIDPVAGDLIPLTLANEMKRSKEVRARNSADAERMLARHPDHPRAWSVVAEARLMAGRVADAMVANERLLTLAPDDPRAHLRMARIMMAETPDSRDAARWKAIRGHVVRANRLDPDDVFALYLYHQTFARPGFPAPAVATTGLAKAMSLAPGAFPVRDALARELLTASRDKEAAAVLAPMLHDPHDPRRRARAQALLDRKPLPDEDEEKDAGAKD